MTNRKEERGNAGCRKDQILINIGRVDVYSRDDGLFSMILRLIEHCERTLI